MKKSLAEELGDVFEDGSVFEDVDLSPVDDVPKETANSKASFEEVPHTRTVNDNYPEKHLPTAGPRTSTTDTFPGCSLAEDEQSPAANTPGNDAAGKLFRKTNFVEHLGDCEDATQSRTSKEYIRFVASTNNRELIDRTADGFFKMETRPASIEIERRQSEGIAALQKTLASGNLSDAAVFSNGNSHAKAPDSGKRPSSLRQVSFAEPENRRSMKNHASDTAPKRKAASRVSLGRALIVAAHKKKVPEPLAPTRFVKLSTDPTVSFKRKFAEFGVKLEKLQTKPDWDMIEAGESRSTLSPLEFYSAEGFIFEKREPGIDKNAPREYAFGVAGAEIVNQCLEPSCPLRWVHTKGPYHHKGDHNNKIMTGLFGHSNPPPEIWNAYRKMVKLTSAGAMMSPDGCPGS